MRRLQPYAIVQDVVGLHEVDEAGVEHGEEAVLVVRVVAELRPLVLLSPEFPLRADEEMAGAGKGRDPAPIDEPGVPAHVVDVQVREDHEVHGSPE